MSEWESYFFDMAIASSTRSKCLHRKEGTIIVHGKRITSTGYNGVPHRIDNCVICTRETGKDLHICNAVHAEENAILQAALYGPSTINGIMYCTLQPCFHCAKLIIQSRISEVYYIKEYADKKGIELLKLAGIKVVQRNTPYIP
jgi:dCMP deaminase